MRRFARGLAWVAVVLASAGSKAQQPGEIVEQAVKTELAADAADHSLWLYYDTDRKSGIEVVQWAAQTREGELDRVLQQGGLRLPPSQQRSRMDRFIRDSGAQIKQRRNGLEDDKRARQMLTMLPNAFIWTKTKQDGTSTQLHFRPNPGFRPPTWEARVFAAMEGDMVVDNAEHRIASLKGKLVNNVKFGWGVLGELKQGGGFDVERRQLGGGIWQITETHVHIQGHAMVFHSISEEEDEVKSKFEELPSDISLEGAEQKLMKMP